MARAGPRVSFCRIPDGKYVIKTTAVIDDFTASGIVLLRGPEWKDWYKKVARYMLKFDDVANPIWYCVRNAGKDKMLLPLDGPPAAPN